MPFDDGRFEMIACQFGTMFFPNNLFFPNKPAAVFFDSYEDAMELRVEGLVAGRHGLAARLGYDRGDVKGPWLLRILLRRAEASYVAWEQIADIPDGVGHLASRRPTRHPSMTSLDDIRHPPTRTGTLAAAPLTTPPATTTA